MGLFVQSTETKSENDLSPTAAEHQGDNGTENLVISAAVYHTTSHG